MIDERFAGLEPQVHRRLDVEHQQRHRDGEDPVGQRFDPVLAHTAAVALRIAVHRADDPGGFGYEPFIPEAPCPINVRPREIAASTSSDRS